LLLVFGLSATLYCTAAVMTVGRVLRSLRRKENPCTWRSRWSYRVVMGLAGIGVLCFLYARFVEPYWPEVTHFRIVSPKIPTGSRPIRIVQISDLHSDPKPRLEERLPELVAAQKPDIILFTGDAINSRPALPVFKHCLKRIAEIAPTYAVKGNWEVWFCAGEDFYGGTNVRELCEEVVAVKVGEVKLAIAGIGFGQEHLVDRTLAALPADALSIVLCHVPDAIYDVAAHDADLCCAGHTHGGQVALPFYGAVVTLSKFGKRFEAGPYRVKNTWLYVNRGIGMEGGRAPRVRFLSRPEITVIELVPEGAEAE